MWNIYGEVNFFNNGSSLNKKEENCEFFVLNLGYWEWKKYEKLVCLYVSL